jgi:hypothetical protein
MTKLRTVPFVDMPGFSYKLANVKVGRSGYQDLADALSQINPALQQFGRISRAKQQLIEQKQEEDRLAREAEIAKGREAFKEDPSGVSEQLKNLTRKGINAGVIPENANAPFIIGGLQAQGEVLVNRDYRDQLRSLVETTNDPEVAIAQTKAEFLKRPEFSDPSVRAYAAEVFGKVDDEFRKDVNSRLDAVRTETNKRAWVELGRPVVDQVIKGQLDVNDPNIIGWLNHSAGVFKGSQEYAWTNLFSETLKEGLSKDPSEEGSISPQQAETFLDNLRTLDLGGGVKFADAEVGKGITEFYNYIEDRRSKWEDKKSEQYNREYMVNLAQAETEILELMGDSDTISPTDEARIKRELRDKTPLHLKTQVNKNINDLLGELRKPSTESTQLSVANLELLIDEGDDLDKTLDSVMKAAADRAITPKERNALIQRIESSRNFTTVVYDDPVMKTLRNGYRETITGFEQFKAGKSPVSNPVGFFTRLGVKIDPQDPESTLANIYNPIENHSVYYQIYRNLGKDAADMFVNKRYVAFEKDLKQAFQDKFDELEQDEETSPQEAKAKLLEQMESISEKVFKTWVTESETLAINKYKVNPALFDQDLEAQ